MKKKIVVASGNKGKLKEIKDLFTGFDIIPLKDMEKKLGIKLIVNENQDTFKKNAMQKARELALQIEGNVICIADDSGISIDALDGFPGLHTARWMNADDHTKNLELLKRMEGVEKKKRTVHYTTAIAVCDKNICNVIEFTLDGKMPKKVRGENGFGFDEIFEIETGKTLAEISSEEKYELSPRRKALEAIKDFIIT